MIVASDLDQTLIYSRRSMGEGHEESLLVPVEAKDGATLSYMTRQAVELLQELAGRLLFIPVTTRTVEQYRRVHLLQDVIRPKYAITSNGGNILVDGEVDADWNRAIRLLVADRSASAEQVRALFQQVATAEWVLNESFCDELFFAYRIDRQRMPEQELRKIGEQLSAWGWEMSIQGRKVYLIPSVVSKRDALLHLKEREGKDIHLATGDSLLDRCMLDAAVHAIAPRHGELYRQEPSSYTYTQEAGILAAVEILQRAIDLLPNANGSAESRG
ncbi:MAG TPA: HAD family hydrolase [Bacilli bacterium]|nr:HAD family hydrolase [Bacilli bacterium]